MDINEEFMNTLDKLHLDEKSDRLFTKYLNERSFLETFVTVYNYINEFFIEPYIAVRCLTNRFIPELQDFFDIFDIQVHPQESELTNEYLDYVLDRLSNLETDNGVSTETGNFLIIVSVYYNEDEEQEETGGIL